MSQSTERPGELSHGTNRPDPIDPDQLLRIGVGPNAKATAETGAKPGFFVRLKLSVAKWLRTLADNLD